MYFYQNNLVDFSILKGKTIVAIHNDSNEKIVFECENGESFVMMHEQDCCEYVYIESIVGDLNDLLGSEILIAEESSNIDLPPRTEYDESYTWTFYKLATTKGYVDIRWYGESNGYYSESVHLYRN